MKIRIRNKAMGVVSLVLLLLFSSAVYAENIDPENDGHQYAWGENVGWIDFEPSQGTGVTVTNFGLSGYAWGENVGWISFSCTNTGECATVDYGVSVNPTTGVFSGYAWGENVGWISFEYTDSETSGVRTSWRNDIDGDNFPDHIENSYCTDANDADSDDDGILDGDEDANRNGVVDAGETDPCDVDTDNDGIQDGTESGYTAGHPTDTDTGIFQPDQDDTTTTDPLNRDSDSDGLPDGVEDPNHNGQVDANETNPSIHEAGIPTLNEWGLILFSGLLLAASVTIIRRKRNLSQIKYF